MKSAKLILVIGDNRASVSVRPLSLNKGVKLMILEKFLLKIKLTLYVTILLVFCCFNYSWGFTSQSPVSSNTTLFLQANQLYEKGAYSDAAVIYSQIIATGCENGNLYYNLGNAYLKQNHKGLAILNYEKARRFIPLDKGLQTNLSLALQGVKEGEVNWGHVFYSLMTHLAPLNWLSLGSSICFYILILLVIIWILFPARVKKDSGQLRLLYKIPLCFISCFLIGFIFLTTITMIDQHQTQAVAIKGNAPVLSQPKPDGTTYFNLDEGSRVMVSSTQGNWCLIRRQDGKRGWVERQHLGLL